jgi:signal transduction histidine kinase
VFTNLLTNSAEAMAMGAPRDNSIVISVRPAGVGKVQVELRDTGMGIPKENAGRVFEPFFTTKECGTGLGLAICQTIVNSLHGEIELEHGQPRGSVFRVLLPAAD